MQHGHRGKDENENKNSRCFPARALTVLVQYLVLFLRRRMRARRHHFHALPRNTLFFVRAFGPCIAGPVRLLRREGRPEPALGQQAPLRTAPGVCPAPMGPGVFGPAAGRSCLVRQDREFVLGGQGSPR